MLRCCVDLLRCSPPLRSITPFSSSRLLVQPGALRRRLVLPASLAQTVAGRNPLATRTLQHEPGDKNKRSSDGARLTPRARKWGDVNAQAGIHTWGRRIRPDRKTRYSSKSSPITNTKCIITDLDPLVFERLYPVGNSFIFNECRLR